MTTRSGLCLVLLGGLLLASCSRHRGDIIPTEEAFATADEVEVDAFLFDAKLWRDGKPTSFRLEVYQADAMAGLSGRGYLGKGALKGRMTADSMIVYFPSSNEYIRESIAGVLGSVECVGGDYSPNLVQLSRSLPEGWLPGAGYDLDTLAENADGREYAISQANCPWQLRVSYTRTDSTWYLDHLEFDSGENTRLSARRRTLKTGTTVEAIRFAAPISPDAVRIIP